MNSPTPRGAPRCCECRAADCDGHDATSDYGPPVGLFVVRDPDANRIVLRGYLCDEHREARASDGYALSKIVGAP